MTAAGIKALIAILAALGAVAYGVIRWCVKKYIEKNRQ